MPLPDLPIDPLLEHINLCEALVAFLIGDCSSSFPRRKGLRTTLYCATMTHQRARCDGLT